MRLCVIYIAIHIHIYFYKMLCFFKSKNLFFLGLDKFHFTKYSFPTTPKPTTQTHLLADVNLCYDALAKLLSHATTIHTPLSTFCASVFFWTFQLKQALWWESFWRLVDVRYILWEVGWCCSFTVVAWWLSASQKWREREISGGVTGVIPTRMAKYSSLFLEGN